MLAQEVLYPALRDNTVPPHSLQSTDRFARSEEGQRSKGTSPCLVNSHVGHSQSVSASFINSSSSPDRKWGITSRRKPFRELVGLRHHSLEDPFHSPHPPFRGRGGFDARLIAGQLSQPALARLPHALRYTQPIYDFLQTLKSPGTEGLVAQLSEPDDLPEGPEVITVDLKEAGTEEVRAEVARIIASWVEIGYCLPEDVLILHARTELKSTVLGACETIAGLPLVEYGTPPEDGKKAIRHLSINHAKGLDALAVIMGGAEPFQKIRKVDNQYTYFMGASRAKQMLAIVHG